MAVNQADIGQYQELLTAFAVELGEGGALVIDRIAPPVPFETQSYAIPKFKTPLSSTGKTQNTVNGDGELPVATSGAPTFSAGKCVRRGQKRFIDLEVQKQPHGDLFADEQVETQRIVLDLMLEQEIAGKAALDAIGSVSGHYASLSSSQRFDYTTADPLCVATLEAAARAAELNSGKPIEDPNWLWVFPPLVADALKQYLRTKLLYTDAQFQIGGKLPTEIAGIKTMLAGSFQDSAKAGQTPSVARVYNTANVYLVYVDPSFANSRRSFTALAQPRWTGRPTKNGQVTGSYAVMAWPDPRQDVYRNWVAADIYDNLETISQDGIYVLNTVTG